MSGFDLGGLTDMLGGFQQQLENVKNDAANLTATGIAGGGAVTVVARGDNQIASIEITDAAMEDRELLEDLVRAAANEALRQVQDKAAEQLSALASSLPFPGMGA